MPDPTQKLELLIDASFLKHSSCNLANFFTLIRGYSYPLVTNDIQFGSAFHHFASQIFVTKGDFGKSLSGAKVIQTRPCETKYKKDFLNNPAYLTTVCSDWMEWHEEKDNFEIMSSDGEPLVEKTFKLKVYEDDNIIIYLCGTIDKIGKFTRGPYGIGDYKTTSYGEVDDYFFEYNLSVQLRTYIYAVQCHAKLYPGSIWEQIASTPLVAFIDGIFLKPPSKGAMAEIHRSEAFQAKNFNMAEYEYLLNRQCEKIAAMVFKFKHSSEEPYREGIINGACEQKFGRCSFFPICAAAHNPILRQAVINKNFIPKTYNPLMFGKE